MDKADRNTHKGPSISSTDITDEASIIIIIIYPLKIKITLTDLLSQEKRCTTSCRLEYLEMLLHFSTCMRDQRVHSGWLEEMEP